LLLLRVARSLIQKDIVVIFDSKNINFKSLTNWVNEVLFRAESPYIKCNHIFSSLQ